MTDKEFVLSIRPLAKLQKIDRRYCIIAPWSKYSYECDYLSEWRGSSDAVWAEAVERVNAELLRKLSL